MLSRNWLFAVVLAVVGAEGCGPCYKSAYGVSNPAEVRARWSEIEPKVQALIQISPGSSDM